MRLTATPRQRWHKARDTARHDNKSTDLRLSTGLPGLPKAAARWNLSWLKALSLPYWPSLEPDRVARANRAFQELFPTSLTELLDQLLADPAGYDHRVARYKHASAAEDRLKFPTSCPGYKMLLRDPVRKKEEHFLIQAMLDGPLNGTKRTRRIADLGCGCGRALSTMAQQCSRLAVSDQNIILGLDLAQDNIRDAKLVQDRKPAGTAIHLLQADMTRIPFPDRSLDFASIMSAMHLIPLYDRPRLILELIRVLKEFAQGVITGPTHRFSAEAYAQCVLASNPAVYLNPLSYVLIQTVSRTGLMIDELCRRRLDYGYLAPSDCTKALQRLGCQVLRLETWPKDQIGDTADIFFGVWFRTRPQTGSKLGPSSQAIRTHHRMNRPPDLIRLDSEDQGEAGRFSEHTMENLDHITRQSMGGYMSIESKRKASGLNYRHFHRHDCSSRLLVLPAGAEEYIEALVIEYGRGGLRFETDSYLVPGTEIDLKTLDPRPQPIEYWPSDARLIPAQVKWCKRLEQPSSLLYRTGIRYMIATCDWCGTIMPCQKARVGGERLTLCPKCLADLETMAEGKLKKTIRQHLLGNVL